MASRLKTRKAGRGKNAATRSRRNEARGGARAAVATRPSNRMNSRAATSGGGRLATRPRTEAKPIGKRDLKELRRLLEAERRRLTDELEAIEEHQPELEHQVGMDLAGSYDEDFADVAGDTFEREKGFAIESSVQALLTQVEEALARMDDGAYGICENCGRPIHPARLRAIPYAKLCIDCKAKEERANGITRP